MISASLGKGRHIQLSQPIRLVLKHLLTDNVTNPTCVFWNYIDQYAINFFYDFYLLLVHLQLHTCIIYFHLLRSIYRNKFVHQNFSHKMLSFYSFINAHISFSPFSLNLVLFLFCFTIIFVLFFFYVSINIVLGLKMAATLIKQIERIQFACVII